MIIPCGMSLESDFDRVARKKESEPFEVRGRPTRLLLI